MLEHYLGIGYNARTRCMNKTYCAAAFNHIYTDTSSRYRLCCDAQPSARSISAEEVLPFDYFFSPRMDSVRKKMLNGEKIPECAHCYNLEEKNINSPRQWRFNWEQTRALKRPLPTKVLPRSIEIKLRIFGNKCNLSCYMCVPRNSTERIKELNAMGDEYGNGIGKHDIFGRENSLYYEVTIDDNRYEEMVQHLIKYSEYIRRIVILGGEPFLMLRVRDFLNRFPNPDKKLNLVFNTNLAQISWLPEFYEKFPNLTLIVSVDHYGKKLEWLRYPIKVQKFEDNLIRARELSKYMSITCTVSRLNVVDIPEIYEYYHSDKFRVDDVNFNMVYWPPALSVKQLTEDQKGIVLGKLKRWINKDDPDKFQLRTMDLSEVIKVIKGAPDPSLDPIFYDYIDRLDKHRGTNAREIFGNFI